ncbi:MAG: FecR domain-containing protein [Dehalococcoidia bacterium]|nr:FecR domain-containing protein [Dehalococcoidia bacterium]
MPSRSQEADLKERLGGRRVLARFLGGPRILALPSVLALLLVIAIAGCLLVSFSLSATPALASQCTLTILSGRAEIQDSGSGSWGEAGDGVVLQAGSRVRTGPDSFALLTFFEGSTIRLEPDTDLQIQRLESAGAEGTVIALQQWLGKTWSRVVQMADPGSRYEIQTPSATALVRGTLFEIEVAETGLTVVRTIEGLVSVTAQGEEVSVAAGHEVRVETGASPSELSPVRPSENALMFAVSAPAFVSVIDPTGASIGFLPDGFSFNQISGAQSTSPSDGLQVVTIPDPEPGDYFVVMRCVADGLIRFVLEGFRGGESVFTHYREYRLSDGTAWVIPVHVEVVDGQSMRAVVGQKAPLGDRMPEKIVITRPVEASPVPVHPSDEPGEPAGTEREYVLALVSSNGGCVSAPGQGLFSYRTGSVVTLVARPDPGCDFDKWSGKVTDPYSPVSTIVMDQAEAVMAHFLCASQN